MGGLINACTTYRVRRKVPEAAPVLEARDNSGRSKDNFVLSQDNKLPFFVFRAYNACRSKDKNGFTNVY